MKHKRTSIASVATLLLIGGVFIAAPLQQFSAVASGTLAESGVAALNKPAPKFNLTTIDGQQFSLVAHRGKPIIVFAMFGGCGECIPVGQTLNRIQKDFAAKGLAVIAFDILKGEPVSVLEQYRSYIHATFQFASYDAGVANAYKLTAPEITYVIDKNGNIAFINRKALSYKQYAQQVKKAL